MYLQLLMYKCIFLFTVRFLTSQYEVEVKQRFQQGRKSENNRNMSKGPRTSLDSCLLTICDISSNDQITAH